MNEECIYKPKWESPREIRCMLLFAKLHIRHEYYMYMLIIVKLIYINVL